MLDDRLCDHLPSAPLSLCTVEWSRVVAPTVYGAVDEVRRAMNIRIKLITYKALWVLKYRKEKRKHHQNHADSLAPSTLEPSALLHRVGSCHAPVPLIRPRFSLCSH